MIGCLPVRLAAKLPILITQSLCFWTRHIVSPPSSALHLITSRSKPTVSLTLNLQYSASHAMPLLYLVHYICLCWPSRERYLHPHSDRSKPKQVQQSPNQHRTLSTLKTRTNQMGWTRPVQRLEAISKQFLIQRQLID
jgi:hypothetical protein